MHKKYGSLYEGERGVAGSDCKAHQPFPLPSQSREDFRLPYPFTSRTRTYPLNPTPHTPYAHTFIVTQAER